MPAFIVHGLIGYLVYGKMGFYLGILPDIIGFSYYFLRVFVDYLSGKEELVKELSVKVKKTNNEKLTELINSLSSSTDSIPSQKISVNTDSLNMENLKEWCFFTHDALKCSKMLTNYYEKFTSFIYNLKVLFANDKFNNENKTKNFT